MKKYILIIISLFITHIAFPQSQLGRYSAPSSWAKYNFDDFEISIPPTMELRTDSDPYQIPEHWRMNNTVFQQKGLAYRSQEALNRYARVIIKANYANYGDFPNYNESFVLDRETEEIFRNAVYQGLQVSNSAGFAQKIIGKVNVRWVAIGDINAVEVSYRRTNESTATTTAASSYFLYNNNKMVNIEVAYREQNKSHFLPGLSNVIKTFKWK